MLTKEQKEILHKAGEILLQECASRRECVGCPLNTYNACFDFEGSSFEIVGKALQKI